MFVQLRKVVVGVALLFAAVTAHAQSKVPPETRNAALRYWLAFADLQDPPADKATAELLEKTAAGEAAWDEAKLGPILGKNETAIWRMQRATKLPDCDWGLEYDLGPRASIAYVSKARVLARLNTLDGMRLAAKGDSQKAVETWLAGIRFSQHLTRGGSLIFSLVAKMGLISNFHSLTQAAQSGALKGEQRKQIEAAVRALPETGFDWGEALRYEEDPLNVAVKQMAEATSLAAYYQEMMDKPAPKDFTLPKAPEIAAFHKLMNSAEEALRLPPDAASERLKTLQDSVKSLHPFFRDTTPSFTRINDARIEVQTARAQLLKALAGK
ncbi:MAG TPA: hypothetical protein VGR03_18780 [Candidatus Acidoferrum sp.]|nr:hypothetical protein [Candidatus Acidoferrum sp.]